MQCPNKFLISATRYSLMNFPDFQTKSSSFYPLSVTQKIHHGPKAIHGIYGENASEKMLPFLPKVKYVTSTSNPFVKHCVKLRLSSSYRHLHGSVLVVGAILVREIYGFYKSLQDRPIIECLLVLDSSHIPEEIDDPSVHIIRVNSVVMGKLSGVQSTDSVDLIALVRIPTTYHVASDNLHEENCHEWFSFPHRILVLDGIQDPGNLGTLLRSATAFRWLFLKFDFLVNFERTWAVRMLCLPDVGWMLDDPDAARGCCPNVVWSGCSHLYPGANVVRILFGPDVLLIYIRVRMLMFGC